ncbi:MAG: PepSY domain-containing protein, partial [Campylobacterales bacterium]|nr:PepSY domain-containing protein [Campylobacterales bacterium]
SVGLVMYVSVFFGLFAIYLPHIHTWEKPSRHFSMMAPEEVAYAPMLMNVLEDPDFPKNDILVTFAGVMGDPAVKISHRFAKARYFEPHSGEVLKQETSHLAGFLNELHYGKPLKMIGRIAFGLMAVGVLSLSVSGLVLIIVMRFKNKGKTPQSRFSKWHIDIFTWTLPVFLLITLTGAMMGVGILSANPMAKILTGEKSADIESVVGPALFPRATVVPKSEVSAPMLPLHVLITRAKEVDPAITFQEARLINWGDASAQVELKGYNPYRPFLNGGPFHKPSVTLSALDGSLVAHHGVFGKPWGAYVAEATFFLHFLFGVDIFSRTFIAFLMALTGAAIGFGMLLWLEKQARKFEGKITFYHWFGKFSLATMVGVVPATGVVFVLQWLLPFGMEERLLWQQGLFYNAWLATLFWAFYRLDSYEAARELLALGGVLFVLAPVLHVSTMGVGAVVRLSSIVAVDVALLALGVGLLVLAKKLPNNRNSAKAFWIRKEKG